MANTATMDSSVQRLYDRIAPRYDRRWQKYLEATHGMALQLLLAQPGDRILDASGGTGLLAEKLLNAVGSTGTVTLVDSSAGMLEQARQRLQGFPNAEFIRSRIEAIDIGDGEYYSQVVCANAFHHYADPKQALRAFHRSLVPGGRMVIVDWCRDPLYFKLFDALQSTLRRTHRQSYTVQEMRGLLEDAHFTVVRAVRSSHRLWPLMGLVATKPQMEEYHV